MSHSGLTYDRDAEAWDIDAVRHVSYRIKRAAVIGAADPPWAGGQASARIVLLDQNVWNAWTDEVRSLLETDPLIRDTVVINPHERDKTVAAADRIVTAALNAGLQRRDEIVAIGGGIVLDLAGVAAALLRKGTPYVAVPTTMVGMIDAGVATKRAVNFTGRKNLVGAYHPPRLTLIDPLWLSTTSPAAISGGLAEALKVAQMIDAELFDLIDRNAAALLESRSGGREGWAVIMRATHGILTHLAADLWESELARWPDHGHTISGTLEMATGGELSHGEAVGIDCAFSVVLSHVLGLASEGDVRRVLSVSRRCAVPIWHQLLSDPKFLRDAIESTIKLRGGAQRWPLMVEIGQHQFAEPTSLDILAAVDLLDRFVREEMSR